MGFDDIDHQPLNWMSDFAFGEVRVDCEEELMSRVYELFCMEYKPEYDTSAFEDQCGNSLHASILTSFNSMSSSYHEALPSMPSSSSLDMKPLPNMLRYVFLGPNEIFPCLLYTSPSPRDGLLSRMPSSA